jgi:hypothetical protein
MFYRSQDDIPGVLKSGQVVGGSNNTDKPHARLAEESLY